jgi:GNAT superfamily N-acetyltransferase
LLEERPPGTNEDDKLVLGEAGTWWIGNLMVDPAWRGQGFGARLYRACEDWIGSRGASKIGLCVQEQNPSAYSFWSRMGYRQTQQVKQRIGSLESTVGILYRELAAEPGVAADRQPE